MTTTSVFPKDPTWDGEGTSRIPFWAYTRDDLYKKELDKFFYNGHWCYVGLEAEIPNPGDFRRTVVGERSVIMVRDPDGGINVIENVCAHRGMRFCRERRQCQRLFLSLSPVELQRQGRFARRTFSARRQARRKDQWRHAQRLQVRRAWFDQTQSGNARWGGFRFF